MNGDPGDDAAFPRVVDLHRRIRAITTGVILLSRVGTLGMVVLSVVSLARARGFTEPALAAITYSTVERRVPARDRGVRPHRRGHRGHRGGGGRRERRRGQPSRSGPQGRPVVAGMIQVAEVGNDRLVAAGLRALLAATARRMGVTIPTVRSYLTRIRVKWAAVDEPVDDVRGLVHEYDPGGRPVGSPRGIVRAAGSLFARPRWSR